MITTHSTMRAVNRKWDRYFILSIVRFRFSFIVSISCFISQHSNTMETENIYVPLKCPSPFRVTGRDLIKHFLLLFHSGWDERNNNMKKNEERRWNCVCVSFLCRLFIVLAHCLPFVTAYHLILSLGMCFISGFSWIVPVFFSSQTHFHCHSTARFDWDVFKLRDTSKAREIGTGDNTRFCISNNHNIWRIE